MASNTDSVLICPKCGESIKLTESLAAPLVAETKQQYERQLAEQERSFADEKKSIAAQQEENTLRALELEATARNQQRDVALAVQQGITNQLATERQKIADQEAARARFEVEQERSAEREIATLQNERIQNLLTQKLILAQAAESDLLKKQQVLEDKERELDLNLQKGIPPWTAASRNGLSPDPPRSERADC